MRMYNFYLLLQIGPATKELSIYVIYDSSFLLELFFFFSHLSLLFHSLKYIILLLFH